MLFFLHVLLQNDLFEVFPVDGVEGVVIGAVDVEDGYYFAVAADGHHDLAFGGRGTGDMSRKLMDVGDDERLVLRPGGATDSFVVRNARASDRTLERT